MQTKTEAQRRADRIHAFREELAQLEEEGVLLLEPEQTTALLSYHDGLLERFSVKFDIDTNVQEKQLSLGMRIASFLGALAFGASLFFLFYQFWGYLTTTAQVLVLTLAPPLFLAGTFFSARRDGTGYFAKILGMLCIASFVLNLVMFGQIFNLESSNNAFLIWAALALLLAYASDARLLLAAGIIAFAGFLSAQMGTWGGCYWLNFGERPENFFPAGIVLFLAGFIPHRRYYAFPQIYRVFGLLFLFIPMLILANYGRVSYLSLANSSIEAMYQILGFVLAAGCICFGLLKRWTDVINTGNIFFVIFLYTKFFDWWWELIPKYAFFLIIGLCSLLFLLIFKRLRLAIMRGKAAR